MIAKHLTAHTKGVRAITDEEFVDLLRSEVRRDGLRQWAKAHGVSPAYVSKVLSGSTKPGEKIQAAMGMRRREVYEREGSEA